MPLQTDVTGAPRPRAEEPAGPPIRDIGARQWVRENLFNSALNTILTIVFGLGLAWLAYRGLRLVFVTAEWEIVRRNLTLFMVGRFPRDELWRPWAASFAAAGTLGLAGGAASASAATLAGVRDEVVEARPLVSLARRIWPLILLVAVLLSFARTVTPTLLAVGVVLLGVGSYHGGRRTPVGVRRWMWLIVGVGLLAALQMLVAFDGVGWANWGGLHLSLFVTVAGIALAFPLGLLLALGRRSSLPVVRAGSIAYIEFFRGVPLITLLLMSQFALGFFFPPGFPIPDRLTRALIAIVIFESAYVAEIVRGGLQSVPRGQVEAAQAVGLSPWKVNRLIVLPQALRAVIPAMVSQFISLFQDTSLLAVVGFLEVLEVSRIVTAQPDFVGRGLQSVTLPFVAFVYWAVSYAMSRESQRLERRLGVGER